MLVNEFTGSGLVAACISREDASLDGAQDGAISLEAFARGDAFLVLDKRLKAEFEQSVETLWREIPAGESVFMVLVPRRAAPQVDPYFDEPVSSFLCSPDVLRAFLKLEIDCWPQTICFAILQAIANGVIRVDRLLVRQLPHTELRGATPTPAPVSLLMPHRGDPRHLDAALHYLSRTEGGGVTVRVGLDVDDPSTYEELAAAYPAVEFFRFWPAPVGPYVIRQELAEASPEPWLSLQDSDDISTYDRFATLRAAMAATGCGVVGSHELCLDEIRAVVFPVRYPVDSSAALAMCPNHALLHATLMTQRSVFLESGGLSTHHIIANDTQFLLRSFFTTSVRNADEFLYVRRRHAASLTNAPDTIHDNPLRRKLNAEWTADFEAVKRGELKLEESSLRPMKRKEPYVVERLRGSAGLAPGLV
jgi:hypothetical protein